MKKALKIIGITLLSLIVVLIISAAIIVHLVLTPQRLTPFVRSQAVRYLSCQTNIDKVDLTFFSTFPDVSFHLTNVCLINPSNSVSDTLTYINDCYASVNIKKYLKNKEIFINKVYIKDGDLNLFIDSLGKSNFNVVISHPSTDTSSTSTSFGQIDLKVLNIDNLNVRYNDLKSGIAARIDALNVNAKGNKNNDDIIANVYISTDKFHAVYGDTSAIKLYLNKLLFHVDGNMKENVVKGEVTMNMNDVDFAVDTSKYFNSADLYLNIPFEMSIKNKSLSLGETSLSVDDLKLLFEGTASQNNANGILMNLDYKMVEWKISDIISHIPSMYKNYLKGIDIDGLLSLSGNISGTYDSILKPVVSANILLSHASGKYDSFPLSFSNVDLDAKTVVDLNNTSDINLAVNSLNAKTQPGTINLSGNVNNLTGNILCDLKVKSSLNLAKCMVLIPKDMNLKMNGNANIDLTKLKFKLESLQEGNYNDMIANGNIKFQQFDLNYNDSIKLNSPNMSVALVFPGEKSSLFDNFITAKVKSNDLSFQLADNDINADLKNAVLNLNISNFLDNIKSLSIAGDFDMSHLTAYMDTVSLITDSPSGVFSMTPSKKHDNSSEIKLKYGSCNFETRIGKTYSLVGDSIFINGMIDHDSTQKNVLLAWDPHLNISLFNAFVGLSEMKYPLTVAELESTFTLDKFTITKSRFLLGKSIFELDGLLTNINGYLKNDGLLKGEFNFISPYSDINQLMDCVSGFGSSDSTAVETKNNNDNGVTITYSSVDTSGNVREDNPFIVPLGVDFILNTKVNSSTYNGTQIDNLSGKLYIKDGVMVLEQMGFTCNAARMQLTALYRSPRKNHLFVSMDFHLLDIDIADLIEMIPDIDSIVPMLKSFAGKGEFHFAAETYMKSDYSLKKSTLKGAAAFNGQNLVVLDSKTFNQIAKYLQFNKKTKNVIDSLSVEMTVFRNEVDVYPFLLSIDKYKAVIGGRHNLDMTFDYNVALIDPLPIRIGLDITGNIDDLHYKLGACKYGNLFKPSKRNEVQQRTLELKQLINTSLRSNVK